MWTECIRRRLKPAPRRGGALLAVLWLTAALSAIAFTVANTVRGETERASTHADGVRAYYLAAGAIERAILYRQWGNGPRNPDGSARFWEPWITRLALPFPTGLAVVEIVPETSKLNVNLARPEQLHRLLEAAGAPPEAIPEIVAGILDWRTPLPPAALTPFDSFYLSQDPSFRARHASIEEIEELLLVRGMTPDLFYGTYERDAQGRLVPRGGLRDCLSVFGSTDRFDANTAEPALLLSLGLAPEQVAALVETRRVAPFRNMEQLFAFAQGNPVAMQRLQVGGNSIYTLRASARLRLADGRYSDLIRSVGATVKFLGEGYDPPHHVLRWYDNLPADPRRLR